MRSLCVHSNSTAIKLTTTPTAKPSDGSLMKGPVQRFLFLVLSFLVPPFRLLEEEHWKEKEKHRKKPLVSVIKGGNSGSKLYYLFLGVDS